MWRITKVGKDLFNDRISRFSIRKLNVGVCSVLLGTLVMVGVANQVSADETSNQTQVEDVTNTTAVASEGTQSQNTVATQASMEVANILSSSEANSQSQAVSTASQIVSEASTTPASSEATSQAAVSTSETSASSVQFSNSVAGTVNVASSTTGASTTASSLAATSESQASASASEAQNMNVEVEASSSNSLSGGVESPVVEQPVVTAETSGKRRSRRSIGDPNDPNLIGDDVQDATSTPKEAKPGFTTNIKATDLASQISWLDFGDTANWTGTTTTSSGNLALQVGSTYTKEIMPGYVVTIKVKSLKPFQATEIYKKRLEDRGATEAEKATYDPNARNGYVNGATSNYTKAAFSAGEEAKVIAEAQNQWTEIRKEGINTGTKKTTISSEFDGGNIGVQFEISATFRGKVVKPAIVMADGESANPGELVMFTTNGEGWQHIGEWLKNNNKNTKTYIPQNTDNLFGSSPSTNINGMNLYRTNLDQLRRSNQVGPDKKAVAWKYFGSADLTTGGLGTGVFGPNISSSDVAVPLVMTKGASEIGLYIVSGGKQSAMFGFFPLDEGDAPESYGKAIHSIATVDGITGKKVNQPYLGHLSPDMDENNALDWFGDDKATTADEGIDQLLPAELKGTTNEMIKMDRTHPGNYTITLEAHTDGAPQANIYGWIDFNQNGTFDEDERSELATITKDGSVTLRFTKSKTYIDPSVNELGVRVRIAKDAVQIESPTGMAFSGEVEDFRTQVTHPPKGEVKETTGLQGEKQSSTVAFTARGLYKYSLTDKAQIDEAVAPQMVDNRTGQVVTPGADGYYAVPGQGKYKITPNGTSVDVGFIPEDHFLGTADGISIRRTDTNGYDTGWSTKFPDMEANVDTAINTMDGLYIPTVTPKDIKGESKTSTDVQGATQTGTPTFNVVGTNLDGNKITVTPSALYPAKLVDPATGQPTNALSVTVAGEGTYTIDDTTGKVTFVPEPGFTGTANGVTVTLSAPVGRDKDGTIRDEYVKTATAKYTPTVTPVTPTATPAESTGPQGVVQTGTVTFTEGDPVAPIDKNTITLLDENGQPAAAVFAKSPAGVIIGTFTVDKITSVVTFTPSDKSYSGEVVPVKVRAADTNGTTVETTYTPKITPVVPTAEDATSTDIQGATQTGKPVFTEGDSRVPMDDDTPATFEDGSKTKTVDGVGTYTVAADGTVTFKPLPTYVGTPEGVTVKRVDKNGTAVTAKYTPTVTPVVPSATPAVSEDVQGATQTGKPEFTAGNSRVPMNDAVPATFDDGSKTKTVDGVGTYTVATDGTVTFVPEPSFTGTAPAVTVVREDMNGTKASATYTPTVNPVTVTPTNKVSEDVQNVPQTETPTFALSSDKTAQITSKKLVDPTTGQPTDDATVTVAGEGSYTIDPTTGAVTFTPEKDFVGTAKGVTVQATATITNENGKTATITSDATYTPTVVAAVPTAQPAKSKDIQGATQTGTPTFAGTTVQVNGQDKAITIKDNSYKLLDKDGNEVTGTTPAYAADGTTVIGNFSIDSVTGTVTFTPIDKSYTGAVTPAKVQAESSNGIKVDTTYTPEIVPVTPTATPAETTDIQGATQKGKPEFQGGTVNVDGVDKTVAINEAVPATFDDGTKTKTIPNIGTYTVASDGTVTFVPEKSFTGTAPAVTVVREDMNGTKAQATYTPTVTPVKPTAEPATSTGKQGQTQTGKPEFTEGNSRVPMNDDVPATFDDGTTTKTVPNVGTYTVASDGTVTFVPEKSFTGEAPAVTVVRKDMNGTKASATYTPTVTPVTPTATPAESTGPQGLVQMGTVTFTEGDPVAPINKDSITLLDENGQPAASVDAKSPAGDVIGTYTVDKETGVVTFTPTDKSYSGDVVPAKVRAADTNGTTVETTYTPKITPVVPTAEPTTSTDIQGATQTGKPVFTEGDSRVPMDDTVPATFDDGSTTKTVDGVGTYTVALDGTVTFVPEKSFVGTAPAVMVVREDKNGTKASATYTPTVTPVTPTATPVETTDIQGATQTGKPVFTEGDSRVPMNDDVPATFDDGSTTKTVDGVGTYTVAADGTVTFVPEKTFTGTAPAVTVVREDKNGTKASATYTPTVTPVTPTATPVETTDIQGATQTGKPVFTEGDSRVPMNDDVPATFDDGSTTKTVDGVGTYTVAADGTVTFVPEKTFTGTAPAVTVVREDKNGTKASATYTPTVTPVTPTATPAESTGPQGLVQTGTVTFTEGDEVAPINKDSITLLDENGQPAASVEAKSPAGDVIGTYTVDKDTGVVTFTPTDKSYSGDVVPVKVQAADANGTTVETTYTPKITPVVPTSEDATSTDIQGQTQSGKPTFTEGNPNVPIDEDTPATFEDGSITKTIPGEGTYTVSPDGTVTFVPEKSFTGTGTGVTVKRVDKNGTEITAKYTPTVTPVTPTAEPATSTDIQGATQTGKPEFTEGDSRVPMNDDVPAIFEDGSTTRTVDGVGTYTVAADGTVTFVPEKSFVGTAPAVTVVREDKNGTKASATYTPSVTPVTPTAEGTTSTDKQGQTQSGTPTFTPGNPNVPMDDDTPATFEDGSITKTIPGEGTYSVAPDGTVTFVPEKSFTGEGTGVTVKRVDKNGTPVTAKYTPTVTPVTPTATPATSEAPQGVVQTGTVTFTEGDPVAPIDKDTITLLDENGQPAASVDAKSPAGDVIGTFTVNKETGVVTFTPTNKSYSGDVVPVKVQAADANGTVAETTYTPKITPVVPTADPATSTDIQGQTQTGKPSFTPGNPSVPMDDDVPATFEDGSTTKVIPGEGTYTVAPDGTVTFVPEKSFTGTGTGVTVKRVDKNGSSVTATYTPTVTPVTPTAKDTTSTGKQGQTQTGKPEFTEGDSRVPMNDDVPATFEDGSTTKTVPGEGTYTVAPDGTVTFVPEKSFTGTGTGVTVKRVDKNGTPVTATYTPTVTPVTPTATPAESTGPQGVVQTGTVTFTEGDPAAPIDKDTITLLDENGQPAASVIAKSPEGKEIGTYTVDKTTGVVTFTPTDKSYSGEVVPVKVQAKDTNGTPTETTYTPKITPVVPTADPATSTDIQGQTQSGTPSFTPGNPAIPMDDDVPATFEDGSTTKTIPGEGTYTVAPDGTVTFVPEKSFTGTGTGVTVKRVDKNGTPVTATYTPTVTPVTPTAESTTSIGNKGQTQTGKPVFTEGDSRVPMNDKVPATFDDGSTTKTIPGVGTYTVAADGTVTFTPEAEFTGTAPAVTVVREDVNGTKASATYTPTVRPITKFVDKEGKEIPGYPALDGEQPKAEISGYRFVETKKLPNGDFEHVYEKVTTSYVDEKGTPIPGYPTEEGQQPKKDIPGYEFVKTVVDEYGNTQHIYKKTVTPTPVPDSTPTPEPQPTPQAKPEESVLPETKEEASFINPTDENAQLPKTGSEDSNLAIFGLASLLAGFGLYGTKRRKR